MSQFSVTITVEVVAWYAAIVSTVSPLFSGLSAWRDRARLSITIRPDVQIRNVPQYDPNKTYIDITIRNRGRRAVKISTVALKQFEKEGYIMLNDSVHQHMPRVLTEENPRTNFFVEQSLVEPSTIEYAIVHDEAGRMYIKHHRRGARFRRAIARAKLYFGHKE